MEIEADWIDLVKAARRIAGYANAGGGAPVLGLVGLDEKRGVVGIDVPIMRADDPLS